MVSKILHESTNRRLNLFNEATRVFHRQAGKQSNYLGHDPLSACEDKSQIVLVRVYCPFVSDIPLVSKRIHGSGNSSSANPETLLEGGASRFEFAEVLVDVRL